MEDRAGTRWTDGWSGGRGDGLSRRDALRRGGFATAAAAAALLGGPALLSACSKAESRTTGGDSLARARSEKKIKVGFANEAPYGFRDKSGKFTGEAPEVAREVFKALGVPALEPVLVDSFAALIPGLNAGQYDVIAAGMFINPERCAQIAFSDPDYAVASGFMVKQGNPKGIKRFEDVARQPAVKMAVLEGAVEQGYALKTGVKSDQIKPFPDASSAFRGLLDGRVDAIALTAINMNWNKTQNYPSEPIETTEPFIPVVGGKEQAGAGGYGFRKNDTALLQAFNTELGKLKRSDRLLQIVKPFGFTETEIGKAKDLTAAQLCSAA